MAVCALAVGSAPCLNGQPTAGTPAIPAHAAPDTRTLKPVAEGMEYAVTSIMPQATLAAQRILESGGNAFDAAVGGQAMLGLVEPWANGLGSDAVLLVYDANEKKTWSINAEGTAPGLATIGWFKKNSQGRIPLNDTLLSATIPGLVDAWYILLSRWGTKSLEQVLQPALEIADRGIALTPEQAAVFNSPRLGKYPTSVRLYQPNGRTWRSGDLFRNPDLARTFRRLIDAEKSAAAGGRIAGLKAARDRFYKGDIAHEMADFSEKNGGLMRYGDFARYAAEVGPTVSFNYHGYVVHKNPSASQGPAELFALNILSGYDLKAMGLNSADYIHTLVEATKLAMADRDKYLGDMDFIRIPYKGLLSAAYGEHRRRLMDPARASLEFRPGDAENYEPGFGPDNRPTDFEIAGTGDHNGDTSFIGVVDARRNAVAFTPSLHSGFGTKVVMGSLGFTLNCRADYFSLVEGHADALAPGKRPRSTLQATLVTKDDKPIMITGCPGGDTQVINTLQTFLNIVDFGMTVQQAIEAPRWTTRSFPSSPAPHSMFPGDLQVESRIPAAVQAELKRRGHKLSVLGPYEIGSNVAIVSYPDQGVVAAGADPRVSALAIAW